MELNMTDLYTGRKAELFGKMLQVAMPKVEHYRLDLYHDAVNMGALMQDDLRPFLWAVGPCGTHIFRQAAADEDVRGFNLYQYALDCVGGTEYRPGFKYDWYVADPLRGTLAKIGAAAFYAYVQATTDTWGDTKRLRQCVVDFYQRRAA